MKLFSGLITNITVKQCDRGVINETGSAQTVSELIPSHADLRYVQLRQVPTS